MINLFQTSKSKSNITILIWKQYLNIEIVLFYPICRALPDRSQTSNAPIVMLYSKVVNTFACLEKVFHYPKSFFPLYKVKLLQYESFSYFSEETKVYFPYRTKKAVPPTLNVDTVSQTGWDARTVSQYDKHVNSIHNDPPTTILHNVIPFLFSYIRLAVYNS